MANIIKKGLEPNRSIIRNFFDVGSFFDDSWLSRLEKNYPAVNISESEKEYNLELIVPGFKKEDIKIKTDDDLLTISAESKSESKDDSKKDYTRREYTYSAFTRTFQLPEYVNGEAIEAHYVDGVLQVKIPKNQTQVRNEKEVPID
ncbi:Hsp20/alpha crystallin family protein [Flavitalea sp.]|nr:Hsp20/alpha crystallin family protein [Flavitalea sp.]